MARPKLKAKATPKAKVLAKANDKGISTKWDKVHTPCSTMTKASNNAAKGWEQVTIEGMTKNGCQAVMGKLSQIKETQVMAMRLTITRASETKKSWIVP